MLALLAAGDGLADEYKEPPRRFVDPVGIDMAEGAYVRNDTFLSIGDSATGLVWTYGGRGNSPYGNWSGHIGDACTNPPPIFSEPSCDGSDPSTLVWLGSSATVFEPVGSNPYVNYSGSAATFDGTTFRDGEGTEYNFAYQTSPSGSGSGTFLQSIKRPNGVQITINGGFDCTNTGVLVCGYNYYSAVSNTGFALKFSAGVVQAVNLLARSDCGAQALTCSTYDNAIYIGGATDSTMLGVGSIFQITDSLGGQWRYKLGPRFSYKDPLSDEIVKGARTLWSFKDPTGYLVNLSRQARGGLTGFTDPRGTFQYGGQPASAEGNESYTNTTKDPSGATIYSGEMGGGTGISSWFKDALNRQTNYGITSYNWGYSAISGYPIGEYSRVISATQPEGDYITYSYDARGNITQTIATPKAGSGLSAVTVYQANYDSTCVSQKTCNQPNWTKDAKGNQTDYTYNTTHGGALTITLPVDQNGLRKRTYNSYTAFDTGAGNIYRITKIETCGLLAAQLSLSACPASTSTSVTTTDYGNSSTAPYTYKSFLPYSVTQADGLGTLSATTTYTYDIIGNIVSIDGPLTGAVDQVFKTYDAKRQLICEIGVDPDDTGPLVRAMVRHTYDAAGRELKTETGTGSSTTSCLGTNMTVSSFKRMTYDLAGRRVRTEAVKP